MNSKEREMWIDNDEGIRRWWQATGKSKAVFIKENRESLDQAIENLRKVAGYCRQWQVA